MADHFFDIETTGLNPYKEMTLTIQFKRECKIVLWKIWDEENEVNLILKFLKYLKAVNSNDSIYGYNILKFDLPFISARLNIHGFMNGEKHMILHNKKWIDLYQCLGDNYISLDRCLRSLGIERQCPFKGRDIPRLYEQKRFREIEEHAKNDLIVCEKLVRKLNDTLPPILCQNKKGNG